MDCYPFGVEAQAASREKETARLQGRRASQATEAATQTTAPQPIHHKCQIPREQVGRIEIANSSE